MSITIAQRKEHLTGQLHGGTLNKVRNIEALFERSANTMLAKLDPLETMRSAALSTAVSGDTYGKVLPSDFKSLIDLIPSSRTSIDNAARIGARRFDLRKAFKQREISIEVSSGVKVIRINWPDTTTAPTFTAKYYSKYCLTNAAGAVWQSRTTSDDDIVVLDNDAIQILLLEDLIAAAQQLEGTDSAFDIGWAKKELNGDPMAASPDGRIGLYQRYRAEHPSMAVKATANYGGLPRFRT